jgi:hypothetical protein
VNVMCVVNRSRDISTNARKPRDDAMLQGGIGESMRSLKKKKKYDGMERGDIIIVS